MTGRKQWPDLSVMEQRALIWFMEELTTKQRQVFIGRTEQVVADNDYKAQADAFKEFLDGVYALGHHDGSNNEQRRIVEWLNERADYLERVGSSFDVYDGACLRREAGAIEVGEHLVLYGDGIDIAQAIRSETDGHG